MNIKRLLAIFMIPALVSCATITVNVYFPDKDVEAAYQDIESGLDFDVTEKKDTATTKPNSRSEAFWGATAAWAEAKINIHTELEKMDDVQESLGRRKERLEMLSRLFDAGWVGLDKTGMVVRMPASVVKTPTETLEAIFGEENEKALDKFITAENKDRKILVHGMAIATLRATEQDEKDKDTLGEAMEKSASIFMKRQASKLKPGWHYQDKDGKWNTVEAEEKEPAKSE